MNIIHAIRIFVSAAVPTLPVTVATCCFAGLVCGGSFSLALMIGLISRGNILEGLVASVMFSFYPMIPIAVIVACKLSFLPNLIGTFIIFVSNLSGNFWLNKISKRAFYSFATGYGFIICFFAFFSLPSMKGDIADLKKIPVFLVLFIFSFAASVSGIVALKFIRMMLRYKLEDEVVTRLGEQQNDPAQFNSNTG